jgi:hypothetical protein
MMKEAENVTVRITDSKLKISEAYCRGHRDGKFAILSEICELFDAYTTENGSIIFFNQKPVSAIYKMKDDIEKTVMKETKGKKKYVWKEV